MLIIVLKKDKVIEGSKPDKKNVCLNLRKLYLLTATTLVISTPDGFTQALEPKSYKKADDSSDTSTQSNLNNNKWQPALHFGGKYGNQRRIGQVALFSPISQDYSNLLYLDFRFVADSRSAREGNFGLGKRWVSDNNQFIYGFYGFYDRRHTELANTVNQITFGLEAMSETWDYRANFYCPENTQKEVTKSSVTVAGTPRSQFNGHDEIIITENTIKTVNVKEVALKGLDLEIGRSMPGLKPLRLYGAYYHFQGRAGVNSINGFRLRADLKVNSYVSLQLEGSHDRVRKTAGFVGISFRIPLGKVKEKPSSLSGLDERMSELPMRDIDIVTNTHAKPQHKSETVCRPNGKHYLIEEEVSSHPDADGTFERPYNLNDPDHWDKLAEKLDPPPGGGGPGPGGGGSFGNIVIDKSDINDLVKRRPTIMELLDEIVTLRRRSGASGTNSELNHSITIEVRQASWARGNGLHERTAYLVDAAPTRPPAVTTATIATAAVAPTAVATTPAAPTVVVAATTAQTLEVSPTPTLPAPAVAPVVTVTTTPATTTVVPAAVPATTVAAAAPTTLATTPITTTPVTETAEVVEVRRVREEAERTRQAEEAVKRIKLERLKELERVAAAGTVKAQIKAVEKVRKAAAEAVKVEAARQQRLAAEAADRGAVVTEETAGRIAETTAEAAAFAAIQTAGLEDARRIVENERTCRAVVTAEEEVRGIGVAAEATEREALRNRGEASYKAAQTEDLVVRQVVARGVVEASEAAARVRLVTTGVAGRVGVEETAGRVAATAEELAARTVIANQAAAALKAHQVQERDVIEVNAEGQRAAEAAAEAAERAALITAATADAHRITTNAIARGALVTAEATDRDVEIAAEATAFGAIQAEERLSKVESEAFAARRIIAAEAAAARAALMARGEVGTAEATDRDVEIAAEAAAFVEIQAEAAANEVIVKTAEGVRKANDIRQRETEETIARDAVVSAETTTRAVLKTALGAGRVGVEETADRGVVEASEAADRVGLVTAGVAGRVSVEETAGRVAATAEELAARTVIANQAAAALKAHQTQERRAVEVAADRQRAAATAEESTARTALMATGVADVRRITEKEARGAVEAAAEREHDATMSAEAAAFDAARTAELAGRQDIARGGVEASEAAEREALRALARVAKREADLEVGAAKALEAAQAATMRREVAEAARVEQLEATEEKLSKKIAQDALASATAREATATRRAEEEKRIRSLEEEAQRQKAADAATRAAEARSLEEALRQKTEEELATRQAEKLARQQREAAEAAAEEVRRVEEAAAAEADKENAHGSPPTASQTPSRKRARRPSFEDTASPSKLSRSALGVSPSTNRGATDSPISAMPKDASAMRVLQFDEVQSTSSGIQAPSEIQGGGLAHGPGDDASPAPRTPARPTSARTSTQGGEGRAVGASARDESTVDNPGGVGESPQAINDVTILDGIPVPAADPAVDSSRRDESLIVRSDEVVRPQANGRAETIIGGVVISRSTTPPPRVPPDSMVSAHEYNATVESWGITQSRNANSSQNPAARTEVVHISASLDRQAPPRVDGFAEAVPAQPRTVHISASPDRQAPPRVDGFAEAVPTQPRTVHISASPARERSRSAPPRIEGFVDAVPVQPRTVHISTSPEPVLPRIDGFAEAVPVHSLSSATSATSTPQPRKGVLSTIGNGLKTGVNRFFRRPNPPPQPTRART